MTDLQQFFNKHASGKKVLLFFILTQLVYMAMLLVTIPKILHFSNGMKILDLMPTGYSAAYAQKLFKTLGAAGRSFYLFQQIPLDLLYPGLFAVSFSLLLAFIFKRTSSEKSTLQKLVILPVFSGLFDYLENIGIIIMLSIYPTFQAWLVKLTNIFSILKSLSTTLVFVLLIISGIVLLIKLIRKKGK
ncbi:hypothetical protein K8S19_13460 [bacterium]|nr:hypothetical protein [bacterium]